MEKYYKIQFTAHLHRVILALKLNCEMEVIWKRGEKVAESGKVVLDKGQAKFDKKITILCNMIYDTKAKTFQEKITKFAILIYNNERGTKQAGQIEFDVSAYVNEKQLHRKQYQLTLQKCPDKNAKLQFTISGNLKQQISADLISQKSYSSTTQPSMIQPSTSMIESKSKVKSQTQTPPMPPSPSMVPTSDKSKNITGNEPIQDKIKNLQNENMRMKEQLRIRQRLLKENEQLKKKLQKQDFKVINEMKKRLQEKKKQAQKMKTQIKSSKQIQSQSNKIQGQILGCKIKIMKAFNHVAEFGGTEMLNNIQQYCGIHEK